MKAGLISVPHSGTQFVASHFQVNKWTHTWRPWDELVEYCNQAEHIYVPLRHPELVLHGWRKRHRFVTPEAVWHWYKCWYQLHALSQLYDLDVICVDKQEDPRINNWKPIGTRNWEGEFLREQLEVNWEFTLELPIVREHYG